MNPVTARAFGRTAFHNGIPYAPSMDENIVQALRGRPVGDPASSAAMKAWIAGWAEANLTEFCEEFPGQKAIAEFAKATKGFGHVTTL